MYLAAGQIGATFINKTEEANRRVPVDTVKYRCVWFAVVGWLMVGCAD